jgi:hypothetical protein
MFTDNALNKAIKDLNDIISKYALQDYLKVNYKNGKKKSKKHIPYSLSDNTTEARDILKLIYGKKKEDISTEDEEIVKGYLLKYKLLDL